MAVTTVYSAVCWSGLTGKSLQVSMYYDVNDNPVYDPKFYGTLPPTGTKLTVKTASAGFAAGTVMYAGYDVGGGYVSLYWDIALTNIVTPTAYGDGYIYLEIFDTTAFLSANPTRYDTRVYNSLVAANIARAALPDASRIDVLEILDAFYDSATGSIGIVNYATEVTTRVNGVRTPAFHNGTLIGYSIKSINGANSNITVDGLIANSSAATTGISAAIDMTIYSNSYYNVLVKNCITVDTNTSAADNIYGIVLPIGGSAENCICITKRTNPATMGIFNYALNGTAGIKNCVAVGFATGILSSGATVQNCIAVDTKVPFYNTGNAKPRRDSNNAVALKDCLVFTPVVGSSNSTITKPVALNQGNTYRGVSLYTTGTFPTVSTGAALSTTEMYDVYIGTNYASLSWSSNGVGITMSSLGTGTHYIVFATKSTNVAPVIIPDYDTMPTHTFVDPANYDFRLAATSLLIDAATSESIYAPTDMLGNVRPSYNNGAAEFVDIGPLEFDKGFGPHPVSATLTLVGLQPGSDVVILAAGTNTILASVDANAGASWSYAYTAAQPVDIAVIKPGYEFFSIMNYALGSVDASVPVSQRFDRNYS